MTEANCEMCGVQFVYELVTKPRRFCSVRCGNRKRIGFKVYVASCGWCGVSIKRADGSGGRNKKFCSTGCRINADTAKRAEVALGNRRDTECQWCFKLFTPKQKHRVGWCSSACRAAAHHHLQCWGDKHSTPLPFCACGDLIQHDPGVSRARPPRSKWCRECREVRRREHDSQRSSHRQRQRRAAVAAGERFTRFDLYETYGSACYLCGEQLSFRRDVPLAQSVSIDHVVPIVLGGEHTIANCRLVHFVCNSRKGAKPLELVSHGR